MMGPLGCRGRGAPWKRRWLTVGGRGGVRTSGATRWRFPPQRDAHRVGARPISSAPCPARRHGAHPDASLIPVGAGSGIQRMRAECLNCAMKYAIADEKLIRTFKIRCKNCAHEIAVHASTGGDEPAEPAPVRWHLLMDDGSVGPMGEVEVRQRFAPAGWRGPPSRHARRAPRCAASPGQAMLRHRRRGAHRRVVPLPHHRASGRLNRLHAAPPCVHR